MKQAKKDGLVVRNVAEDMILPKVAKKKPVYLEGEEIDRFLDVAEKDRFYPAFLTEMGTGVRRGELLGLKWTDIDFRAKALTVRRQLVILRGKPVFHEYPKTEAGERTFDLPDEVVEVLRFHQRRQDAEKEFLGDEYEGSDLVFCQKNGRPIHPRNFVWNFHRLLEDAKVRHIPFHGTRHTHATELLRLGVSMKTIQERLGHSSFKVTADTYTHVAKELQMEAAEKMNGVLKRHKEIPAVETTVKPEVSGKSRKISRQTKSS